MATRKMDSQHSDGSEPVLAIAFYSEVEWAKLKRTAADPDALDDTYAGWCRGHADLVSSLEDAGTDYVSVPVLVEDVSDWCAREGRPLDGAARAEFVAQQHKSQGGRPGGA